MKTKEDILKEKAGIYQFTNGWTFEDDQKLIKAIYEAMEEYANQFRLFAVSGSLPTLIEGDKFNIISGIFINPVEIVEIGLEFNVSPYIEPNVNIVAKKLWGGNDR